MPIQRPVRIGIQIAWLLLLAGACGPRVPVDPFEGMDSPDPVVRAEAEERVAENVHQIAEDIEGGNDISSDQVEKTGQLLTHSAAAASSSVETRRDAVASLARLGWDMPEEAVPVLFQALDDEDAFVRGHAVAAIYRWAKRHRIDREQVARWKPAARATVELIPGWLEAPDTETRLRAARIARDLEGTAHAAEPGLVRALRDPDEEVRINAAWGLVEMHGKAEPLSSEELVEMMGEEPHKDVRSGLALVIAGRGAAAVPALVAALQNADGWGARKDAAFALGEIGPAARSALPALRARYEDAILFEAATIKRAIEKIEGRADE